jgi:hypothetical protein
VWCARITWALLPVTMGTALADALDSWSTATASVAAGLMWIAWAAGLAALFIPRTWALTVVRVAAPLAVLGAVFTVSSTSVGAAIAAIGGSIVAAVFALSVPVASANANALAYGDEQRVPLRTPTPLLAGPIPIAVLAVGFGIATGPLLLATGRIVLGIVAVVVGFPLAFLVGRSLNSLSGRWLVFVPAGIAIVDPLTLADPVLVRRENISSLRRTTSTTMPAGALDLRLGTLGGGVALALREPVQFARRRGRIDADIVEPVLVVVAVPNADAIVQLAGKRRIATA